MELSDKTRANLLEIAAAQVYYVKEKQMLGEERFTIIESLYKRFCNLISNYPVEGEDKKALDEIKQLLKNNQINEEKIELQV